MATFPAIMRREAALIDQPIAGLLRNLARRGMLDDTLVIFNTEFGRTPFAQSAAGTLGKGRDHNQSAYTVWMAGAGLKPGFAYGIDRRFWRLGRPRAPSRCTISMPRFCICSASTTSG